MRETIHHYKEALKKEPKALNYLFNRGLTRTTISHFMLGVATTYQSEKQALATVQGLEKSKNGHPYFVNRIMIPITARTFTSRDLGDVIVKQRVKEDMYIPKYKHSKAYLKGSMLYNSKSLGKISKNGNKEIDNNIGKRAFVVESHFNTLSLHQELAVANLTDTMATVAVGGSELTQAHIDILKENNVTSVTLMFDGDKAGLKGMVNALLLLIKNRIEHEIVVLPTDKDVNDILIDCITGTSTTGEPIIDNKKFLSKTIYQKSINPFVFYAKYLTSLTANKEKLEELRKIQDVFDRDIIDYKMFQEISNLISQHTIKIETFHSQKTVRYLNYIFLK